MTTFTGTSGNDSFTGTSAADTFNLQQGGNDTARGLDGADLFDMGAAFNALDRIDGGAGQDSVFLDGDYSAGLVLGATTIVNVEKILLAAGNSYRLVIVDGNVAAGAMLEVDGSALSAGNSLVLDGTNERDGSLVLDGGAGNDELVGGTYALSTVGVTNTFNLQRGGSDVVQGGVNAINIVDFGSSFTAADQVLGNQGLTGTMTIVLDGNYAGAHAVTMNAATMVNVDTLQVTAGHSYTLVSGNANLGHGQDTLIDGSALGAGDSLHFDGSAQTAGVFNFIGGAGNDVLTAAPNGEAGQRTTFDLSKGGNDTATGSLAADTFVLGGALTAADRIDGVNNTFQLGLGDALVLDGNYTGSRAVTLGAKTVVNIQRFEFEPGHSYTLTTNDATVAAGKILLVDASALHAGNQLTFDGSAESDGQFDLTGGAGGDVLTGGTGNDYFDLRQGGSDAAFGGAGDDYFDLGGKLNAGDKIDGGAGNDTVNLDGDYSAGVTFSPTTMRSVRNLVLGGGHDYKLALADATIAAGGTLSLDATAMVAGDTLNLDNTAATNGQLLVTAGDGRDVIRGGAGADSVDFGTHYNANDFFNGGAGDDFVGIGKATSANMVLSNLKNIETLGLEFDNYHVTTTDGLVTKGKTLLVDFDNILGDTGRTMWFDGSAETNGSFDLIDINGGMGVDHLVGGAQGDVIESGGDADFLRGGGGADFLRGGGGNDTYFYARASDSTSATHDTIFGFDADGSDTLVLHNDPVSGVDHRVAHGALSNATFDSDLVAAVDAGHLAPQHAVLFTPDAGSHAGQTFLVIDANGHAGYQAGADYVMRLENPQHIGQLSAASFGT